VPIPSLTDMTLQRSPPSAELVPARGPEVRCNRSRCARKVRTTRPVGPRLMPRLQPDTLWPRARSAVRSTTVAGRRSSARAQPAPGGRHRGGQSRATAGQRPGRRRRVPPAACSVRSAARAGQRLTAGIRTHPWRGTSNAAPRQAPSRYFARGLRVLEVCHASEGGPCIPYSSNTAFIDHREPSPSSALSPLPPAQPSRINATHQAEDGIAGIICLLAFHGGSAPFDGRVEKNWRSRVMLGESALWPTRRPRPVSDSTASLIVHRMRLRHPEAFSRE
jgi:hypothetical protein